MDEWGGGGGGVDGWIFLIWGVFTHIGVTPQQKNYFIIWYSPGSHICSHCTSGTSHVSMTTDIVKDVTFILLVALVMSLNNTYLATPVPFLSSLTKLTNVATQHSQTSELGQITNGKNL